MAGILSLGLRERMIAAIEVGPSCEQAAERFGIAKEGGPLAYETPKRRRDRR